MACPAEVGDKPLWPDTAVVVFHIRRKYKTWPEQLRYFILEAVLHQTFGREPGRLRLPELDVHATDPAAAFAELRHEACRLKPDRIARLALILDGLDELPASPGQEAGIADFIPRPEALPEGCFLLLTSRPLAECPPHVRQALADRFADSPDFAGYELRLDDASGDAYRQLLRAYFDRELGDRLKAELHQALAGVVQGQATVSYRNDLKRLQPPRLASFAQQEWTELTRGVTRGDGQDLSGALADYGQAIELREALRRQLGAAWPPAWAHDLAGAYMNRGILLEDTGRLEEAIADWDGAAQIYLNLVERGQLRAGSQLLKAVSWQFGGFRDLGYWLKAALCLLQFLAFLHGLHTAWTAQQGEAEPPWQAITAQFARIVHGLNPEQRAALLDALGEEAEGVKEVFGWE